MDAIMASGAKPQTHPQNVRVQCPRTPVAGFRELAQRMRGEGKGVERKRRKIGREWRGKRRKGQRKGKGICFRLKPQTKNPGYVPGRITNDLG